MRRILEVGSRRIDLDSGEVEGVGLLRPMERAVLAYLAENQDRAVPIHELHTRVWGYAPAVNSRAAYTTISRLRPAIEPNPAVPLFLTAERGEGYRLRNARIVTEGEERVRTNVRAPSDPFFGREAETRQLRATRGAPITVVGPAGVGKTRWILEVAPGLAPWGGVWFVDLDGCVTRAELLARIARAVPGAPSAEPESIAAGLGSLGACWVVLDGAERVPDVLPGALAALTAGSTTWIVTSRQRLGLPAEAVVELFPLDRAAAVDLLRDRVGRRSPRWVADLDDAIAMELCAQVDDLPLAIEIVASNVAVVGPSVVLDSLRRGVALPLGVQGPARHRTLDAAVASTLEQLGPSSVDLVTRLAVVEGGLRLDAAEAVLGLDDAAEPLARLAHATALAVDASEAGTRFRLHATVRSFARRHLSVPHDAVLERLLAFVVARMESGDRVPGIDAVAVRQLATWLRGRPTAPDTSRRLGALLRAARGAADRDLALDLAEEALALGGDPRTLGWRATMATLRGTGGDPEVAVREEPRAYVCALAHRWADPARVVPPDAVARFRRWASELPEEAASAGADLLESRTPRSPPGTAGGAPADLAASAAEGFARAGAPLSAAFVEVHRARRLLARHPDEARACLARASAALDALAGPARGVPALARQAVDCAREALDPGVTERAERLLRQLVVDDHLDRALDWAAGWLDPRRAIAPGAEPTADAGVFAERDAFVGREAELADLAQRFASGARLVTVSGIGGTGKTRLAVRHGQTTAASWPGGVRFCDLSDARTLDGVLHAVARAFDCVTAAADPIGALGRVIAARGRCLVVLDNFEQVTQHASATVGRWMDRAPEAAFLVTSRERLGLAGEEVLALPPLAPASARALFLLRAAASNPAFDPEQEPDAIDALLDLLDRLPLAIELAAARLRMMSVADVLSRMTHRFRLLVASGRRNDRQATLRATLDGSWDLLSDEEQDALARLAVFDGGFDLAAAEAVIASRSGWPLDVLQSLVDRSMVQFGDGRFHLLNTVRDYAHERLVERGGQRAAEVLHGAWFARYASLDAVPRRGRGGGWRTRAADLDNLVAACTRAIERGDAAVATQTLACVGSVVQVTGPFRVGLELAERVLALDPLEAPERAIAQYHAGKLTFCIGHLDRSIEISTAALATARIAGDAALEARTLTALGVAQAIAERLDEARESYEASLAIHARSGPSHERAIAMCNLAMVFVDADPERCERLLRDALAIARSLDSPGAEGLAVGNLGWLAKERGRLEEAERWYLDALVVHREIGNRRSEANSLLNLAQVWDDLGRIAEGRATLEIAVARHAALGDRAGEGRCLTALGDTHAREGRIDPLPWYERALTLFREVGHLPLQGAIEARIAERDRTWGRGA